MKVYNGINNFKIPRKSVLTLGTFDGVHLGHQSILKRVVSSAEAMQCESVVLTFFPHPRMVLQQDSNILLLNTISEKSMLLEKFGIDNLIIHPFDEEFSNLSAEDFVFKILVQQLNIAKIIIGYDHRFGKNRMATINDLIAFGKKYDFEVEQILAEEINEVAVSSTKIRKAISEGNIKLANTYLGYNYFVTGKVVHGKKLGRTIGFPTANIELETNYKLIPSFGVYLVSSFIDGVEIYGMMNIGVRPTVAGELFSIEVHFLNFNSDLYNNELVITLHEKIREEIKFNSVAELKEQLNSDKEIALNYFSLK